MKDLPYEDIKVGQVLRIKGELKLNHFKEKVIKCHSIGLLEDPNAEWVFYLEVINSTLRRKN